MGTRPGRGGDEGGDIGGTVIKRHSGFDIGHIVRLENLHGFDARHPFQGGFLQSAQDAVRVMDTEDHGLLAGLRRKRSKEQRGRESED
jgi:hypothetical protein